MRRAFSVQQAAPRAASGGAPELAGALRKALAAAREQNALARTTTHGLHTYPARMHPATARALLLLATDRPASDRAAAGQIATGQPSSTDQAGAGQQTAAGPPAVLDPFCGSGTTLVEARWLRLAATGVDLNPLAVAIARAKTWAVKRERREALARWGDELVRAALAEGKAARRSGYQRGHRAPAGSDRAERDRLLSTWFAAHVRRELEFLAEAIDRDRDRDPEAAQILEVVLSSILYKASRRASDTSAEHVDRRIARGAPARWFGRRLTELCDGLDELVRRGPAPLPAVHCGDARALDRLGIAPASFDAVLTSPPYAGTYDYLDQHAMRLAFLGWPAAGMQRAELGPRRAFGAACSAPRARSSMNAWERDLRASLAQMARAVRPGGRVILVMGDSLAAGAAVRADELIRRCAGELEPQAWAWESRPLLGWRERRAFADQPKREHAVLLRRP